LILAAPNSMRKPITSWQRHKTECRSPADIWKGCGFQEFGAYSWLGSVCTLSQPQASNPTSQYHIPVPILLWAALFLYMAGVWILSSLGPLLLTTLMLLEYQISSGILGFTPGCVCWPLPRLAAVGDRKRSGHALCRARWSPSVTVSWMRSTNTSYRAAVPICKTLPGTWSE